MSIHLLLSFIPSRPESQIKFIIPLVQSFLDRESMMDKHVSCRAYILSILSSAPTHLGEHTKEISQNVSKPSNTKSA
jgi:hypothetical protein